MSVCLFCQIVAGEKPSYKIYEDETFMAFLDVFPQKTGHTLLIPKIHYRYVWDMADPGALLTCSQKIVRHYQSKLKTQLIYASIMGEQIPHAHVHLIPQNVSVKHTLPELVSLLKMTTP